MRWPFLFWVYRMHNASMSDTAQQVKAKLSIMEVVGGYVKLERAGQNMRARCPFHAERSPSFMVSPERGTYHCFGCGVGGDIFSFVQAIEGLDFKGALKVLAERAGVPLVYAKGERDEDDQKDRLFAVMETATMFYQTHLSPDARAYLHERGLTDTTITHFRIGWAGNGWSELADHLRSKKFTEKEIVDAGLGKKNERGGVIDKFRNRIMFPIADSAGRVVAFSGRSFGSDAHPDAPKYLNSPETPLYHKSRILYGFDKAKAAMRRLNCAVLVEGQVDLVMSHQAGWENAVAVSGTAFTEEHAVLIKRMTENLVIALDADEAGFKAAGRAARASLAMGMNVKVAQLPEDLDPADLVVRDGPDALTASIRAAKDIVTFLLDTLAQRLPQADRFRRAVEAGVLPFIRDVQSPIAREQYTREVAQRLGVSEAAVSETLRTLPASDVSTPSAAQPERAHTVLTRARRLYGLLLIESGDAGKYLAMLRDSVGRDVMASLEGMPDAEKEALRFEAERIWGTRPVEADIEHLLRVLERERLSTELATTSAALKRAEAEGDQDTADRLLEASRVLTTQIARLHDS